MKPRIGSGRIPFSLSIGEAVVEEPPTPVRLPPVYVVPALVEPKRRPPPNEQPKRTPIVTYERGVIRLTVALRGDTRRWAQDGGVVALGVGAHAATRRRTRAYGTAVARVQVGVVERWRMAERGGVAVGAGIDGIEAFYGDPLEELALLGLMEMDE